MYSYAKYQSLLRSLTTDEQFPAATLSGGPVYVYAPAGSGKTRLYSARFCHLVIDRDVRQDRILGITFSRVAAEEMRERVAPILGVKPEELKGNISTFHSLGFNILKKEGLVSTSDINGLIVPEWKQRNLVVECLENNKLGKMKNQVNEILQIIGRWKGRMIKPDSVATSDYANLAPQEALLTYIGAYKYYEDFLEQNDKIDYQDMITKAIELLKSNSTVLAKYQAMWDHILVDESQDTDYSQMQLISLLGKQHSNVMVFLDPRQSIYAWRGGNLGVIDDFIKAFPNAQRCELTRNYRSLKTICDHANQTASRMNIDVSPMISMRGDGGTITTHFTKDKYDHGHNWAAEDIKAKIEAGGNPRDFAILSRLNVNLAHFEDALSRHDVPYRLNGGLSVYERRELRGLLLLGHLAIEDDPDALRELMQKVRHTWFKYMSNDYINKMFIEYGHNPVLGLNEFKYKDQYGRIKTGQMNAATAAAGKLSALREKCANAENLPQLLSVVLEHGDISTTIRDQLIEWGSEDADLTIDNDVNERIGFLKDIVRISERYNSLDTFNNYLSMLAQTNRKKSGDAVTLSSIHKAKGLEWKHVYVVDVTDNHLPHENGDLSEERRIYYVAITRAKDNVVLITDPNNQSRFINGEQSGNN